MKAVRIGSLLALLCLLILSACQARGDVEAAEAPAAQSSGDHPSESGQEESGTLLTAFKWVNFLLVLGAAVYFLRPRLSWFAAQRVQIRAQIDEARRQREESLERQAAAEERLARLEQETEAMRREAAAQAAEERERIRESTRREADRILATARAEMDSSLRAARLELRAYTARLAVNRAEERIRGRLNSQAQAAFFQYFLDQLSAAPRERRR